MSERETGFGRGEYLNAKEIGFLKKIYIGLYLGLLISGSASRMILLDLAERPSQDTNTAT
jgi:hypothetical protein